MPAPSSVLGVAPTPSSQAARREAARSEPALTVGPLLIGFDDAVGPDLAPVASKLGASLLIGFDDPQETSGGPAIEFDELPQEIRRRAASGAMAVSLVWHVLFLGLLLNENWVAKESAIAVPVHLIVEKPASPPGPKLPADAPQRMAAGDVGENLAVPKEQADSPVPDSAPVARLLMPAAHPSSERPSAIAVAKPPARRQEAIRRHIAREIASSAIREQYFARLVKLTRQHLDLLPISLIGGHRGETILKLRVRADGTITRIAVVQGSGYRDIDDRVLRIVAAVQRFPPLPEGFGSRSLELRLRFRFPDAVLER